MLEHSSTTPSSAQPGTAAETRQFNYRRAAEDWVWSPDVVSRLTPSEHRLLNRLARYCGPNSHFEPYPPLYSYCKYRPGEDDHKEYLQGMLEAMGNISHHAYLQVLMQLRRKRQSNGEPFITKSQHGGGYRPNSRDVTRRGRRNTKWKLHVQTLQTVRQDQLFRTEEAEDTFGHEKSHGQKGLDMRNPHGQKGLDMRNPHGQKGLDMRNPHGQTDRPLYNTHEQDTSENRDSRDHPHTHPEDENDDNPVLFSVQFIASFVERANAAFDLNHEPYCQPDCKYHGPIYDTDFGYLGGGDAHPDVTAVDRIISGTITANPRMLLRYLRTSLENLLTEQGATPRVEPTLPSHRQAAPPTPPPPSEPERQPHFASCEHIEQSSYAAEKWMAVLFELKEQVPRPAFETWLTGTEGLAVSDEEFVVGTSNAFVSEMLEHRMYPLIERAVEQVMGKPVTVRFQVMTACSICAAARDEPDNRATA